MSSSSPSLAELALKYKSDKGIIPFKDGQYMHGYTSYYETIFAPRREQEINILDIGAWGENQGGSTLMWREYFPNAHIYALDYYEDVKVLEKNHDRITAFQCNLDHEQETIDKVAACDVYFDIVIEDASHNPWQQMRTLLNVSSFLSSGFDYIIEDVAVNPALVEAFIAGTHLPHMSCFEWFHLMGIVSSMEVVQTSGYSKLVHLK